MSRGARRRPTVAPVISEGRWMRANPDVTVIVVARDRWSLAPAHLSDLLARTNPSVRYVLVDGAAPRAVAAAFDRLARTGRAAVVRRNRFLASNEARNVGAEGVRSEWIAFVENDCTLSDGWIDRLLEVGETRDATIVYPAFLQEEGDDLLVHGLGADLVLNGPKGSQRLREEQHHVGELWREIAPTLQPVERIQAEPHAFLMRRSLLESMGGFDEGFLSWYDHTDVALHMRRLGGTAWLTPDVTCTYRPPPPVAPSDFATMALRWGRAWRQASVRRLCTVWGLDLDDPWWELRDSYRRMIHARMPTPWTLFNQALGHVVRPIEWAVARSWARQASDAR